MKKKFRSLVALMLFIAALVAMVTPAIYTTGCSSTPTAATNAPPAALTTFNSLSATEALVDSAYSGYIDAVALKIAPTNALMVMGTTYNEMKLSIHSAAFAASGGMAAATPATVAIQANSFTVLAAAAKGGK